MARIPSLTLILKMLVKQTYIETLIRDVQGSMDMCLVADFISGNHNLSICQEFDNNWEQDFLSGSSTSSKRPQNDGDPGSGDEEAASDDDDGEGGDDELVCLKGQSNISIIQQAILSLEYMYFSLTEQRRCCRSSWSGQGRTTFQWDVGLIL